MVNKRVSYNIEFDEFGLKKFIIVVRKLIDNGFNFENKSIDEIIDCIAKEYEMEEL